MSDLAVSTEHSAAHFINDSVQVMTGGGVVVGYQVSDSDTIQAYWFV